MPFSSKTARFTQFGGAIREDTADSAGKRKLRIAALGQGLPVALGG
jgi:hypothetical protein